MTANRKRTKWTTELMDEYLKVYYPWVYLIPGQKYTKNRAKYWFYCHTHGAYEAEWSNVYTKSVKTRGSQCPRCSAAKVKARVEARNDAKTKAYVGSTTFDGHKVHELVRYHQTPSCKKQGRIGKAVYRYTCGVCGNDRATAWGNSLKKPGHTTHCGCLSKRDSRLKFSRSEKHAAKPCFFYIFSAVGGCATKIGISNNIKLRASTSYEQELFISPPMPRADCWAIEQCMLNQLRMLGLQFDLTDIPAFEKGTESGGSEVLVDLGMEQLMNLYRTYAMEILSLGWQGLLDAYIPYGYMYHSHRFYWDGDRMSQVTGENFKGLLFENIFEVI